MCAFLKEGAKPLENHFLRKSVCIYVPYPRLVKHSLSKPLVDVLNKKFDLYLLLAFGISKSDVSFLGLREEQIVQYSIEIDTFKKAAIRISDIIRRLLYFKERQGQFGLSTYYQQLLTSGRFGHVVKIPLKIIALLVPANINVWRRIDRILSFIYSRSNPFDSIGYQFDLIVHSSNWGVSDILFAKSRMAKTAKNVLLPYTTDQLYATGYLLNDFSAIYPQSPLENRFLKELHTYYSGASSIVGSMWFRNIDYFIHNSLILRDATASECVYAGVDSNFFPKKAEIEFVNKLAESKSEYLIRYYPLGTQSELEIIKRCINRSVEIQVVNPSIVNTEKTNDVSVRNDIRKYLEKICNCTIFIMSYSTSMAIDYSYITRRKIYSYYYDKFDYVRDSIFSDKERKLFFGESYSELDHRFCDIDDFEVQQVESPASDLWDFGFQIADFPALLEDCLESG